MLSIPPSYEGRLISVIRRWAGSGGWRGRRRCDATTPSAVQAARSRCANRASLGRKAMRALGAKQGSFPKGGCQADATSPQG